MVKDLKFWLELTYKLIKARELGVSKEEVPIPRRPSSPLKELTSLWVRSLIEIIVDLNVLEPSIDPTLIASTSQVSEDLEMTARMMAKINSLEKEEGGGEE